MATECRLCLFPTCSVSIFNSSESDVLTQIRNCCQLQVEKNDGLPDRICSSCLLKLETFVQFKRTCEHTDKILRGRLDENMTIKVEETSEKLQNNNTIVVKIEEDVNNDDDDDTKVEKIWNDDSFEQNNVRLNAQRSKNADPILLKLLRRSKTDKEDLEKMIQFDRMNANGLRVPDNNDMKCNVRITFEHEESKQKNGKDKAVEEKDKHECNTCGRLCSSTVALQKHLLTHSSVRYECGKCDKFFFTKAYLDSHESVHSKVKRFACGVCEKVFAERHRLRIHEFTHSKVKQFPCELCGKRFAYSHYVSRHIKSFHLRNTTRQCNICGKVLSHLNCYKSHLKTHSTITEYQCDYCGKEFKHRNSLILHIRSHTGERPYKCEVCLRAFNSRGILKSHILQHTGENPFKCELCSKGFKQRCNLKSHMRHFHKKF